MSGRKGLVLDANILLRAVFGQRVREILETYEDEARFYAPDVCFADAEKYIPEISKRRGLDADLGLSVLEQIGGIVERVDGSLYEEYESTARGRVASGTLRIGPLSQSRCYSNSRFGPKIRISSEAGLRPGPLIEWNCTCGNNNPSSLPSRLNKFGPAFASRGPSNHEERA